jgi:hypothetical protein
VITDNKYLMIGAAVAGLALAYAITRGAGKVIDAVPKALEAVNPLNNDNVINKGFTSIYQGVTGSDGTLGTDVYDVTHNGTFNPASDNNLINRGVSGIGGAVTGNKDWSLGTAIYDWTH